MVTDVLSFPQLGTKELKYISKKVTSKPSNFQSLYLSLGDIVINLQSAKRQAVEHGLSLDEEINRLIIHGLLHLLGYDHEKNSYQKKKMELKEKELFDALTFLCRRKAGTCHFFRV